MDRRHCRLALDRVANSVVRLIYCLIPKHVAYWVLGMGRLCTQVLLYIEKGNKMCWLEMSRTVC